MCELLLPFVAVAVLSLCYGLCQFKFKGDSICVLQLGPG